MKTVSTAFYFPFVMAIAMIMTSPSHAENIFFEETKEDNSRLYAYENENAEMVLDDLVIYASPKSDDISKSISNSMVTRIWKSLGAGEGVGVNFDFSFAPNSAVLTADGNHLLELVVRAIKILDSQTQFEIQTHNNRAEALSKARADSIVTILKNNYKVLNSISVAKYSRSTSPSILERIKSGTQSLGDAQPDMWRVTIVNKGKASDSWFSNGLAFKQRND